MKRPPSGIAAGMLRGTASTLLELARIAREMLAIPAQLWLAVAEIAGAAVLSVWFLVVRVALFVHDRAIAAREWAQRRVRPAHGVIAVCIAAALALGGSQLLDYRGVTVGAAAYSEVEAVAPAPEVDRERAPAAHGWAVPALAAAALLLTALAALGRWRLARLLVAVGGAVVAISILVDAPRGLDAGEIAVAYEGTEAILLEGFWAQLAAGSALIFCGLLLAAHLRPRSDRAAAPRRRARLRSARSGSIAGPPMGTGTQA